MPENGANSRADIQHFRLEKLKEDLITALLDLCKQMPGPWQKMTGDEQERFIDRIDRGCVTSINQVADIIASRAVDYAEATLDSYSCTTPGTLVCKVSLPANRDDVRAVIERIGQPVMLITRDHDKFLGGATPKADNETGLAIPKGYMHKTPTIDPPTPTSN